MLTEVVEGVLVDAQKIASGWVNHAVTILYEAFYLLRRVPHGAATKGALVLFV